MTESHGGITQRNPWRVMAFMGCGKLGFPQFEKRERKSPKPELLLPCPGTEAGMDINFPERFLLFLSLEPGSSLSLFHHFCDCCYHCSLFAFVLTEQTLKGYFVRMSPTTSAAQDEFSFILFFSFGCTRS